MRMSLQSKKVGDSKKEAEDSDLQQTFAELATARK